MTGTVVAHNRRNGFVAVDTPEGYSIFELLGDDPPEMGARVSWRGSTPLGHETVVDLEREYTFDVFFQNHHVSKRGLRAQLGLR